MQRVLFDDCKDQVHKSILLIQKLSSGPNAGPVKQVTKHGTTNRW